MQDSPSNVLKKQLDDSQKFYDSIPCVKAGYPTCLNMAKIYAAL